MGLSLIPDPEIPEPGGWGGGLGASGKPAPSDPTWPVLHPVLWGSWLFVPASVPGFPHQTPQGRVIFLPSDSGLLRLGFRMLPFLNSPQHHLMTVFPNVRGGEIKQLASAKDNFS